jgi:putative ABC transport system substrate-binding protein
VALPLGETVELQHDADVVWHQQRLDVKPGYGLTRVLSFGSRSGRRDQMTAFIGRREFIAALGGVATWPLAARAQQPAMPVIGFMSTLSPENVSNPMAGFHQGLKEAGYIERQNVAVEYRWARGHYDQMPELAADLVRKKVAVIVASGGDPSPQIAKAATQTIPIVFGMFGDPVKEGLVDSLSRPGSNATGVTIFGPAAVTKRLQLLHDLVPHAAVTAFLMNPNNPNGNTELRAVQTAATSLGKQIVVLGASSESELDAAFARMAQQRIGTLLGASDPFLFNRRDQIVSLAARHGIPAIYYLREFARAGGLMAYGNSLTDMYRLVGVYVGRILKGEKPADLPVVQSTKFEFVVNLQTARALGIEVPNSMQLLADEVIE